MAILLFGDQIQFKINSWIPQSNRFQRDYSTEVVEYVTYNEEKTARKIVRGLKEKYTITLYDWSAADLSVFNAIETSTIKNIITFYPSLDADTTKVSYFEYYIDPFNKFLKIEITPVPLLNYSTLPALETYANITQVFGNTIEYSQPILGSVELPRKTVCKISVDYFTESDRISITGKIHREYKYKTNGEICKKIIFTGTSFDITNDLYNSLRVYQGVSETEFGINSNYYHVVPILQFMPILKNQWKLDFKCEVQDKYTPISIRYVGMSRMVIDEMFGISFGTPGYEPPLEADQPISIHGTYNFVNADENDDSYPTILEFRLYGETIGERLTDISLDFDFGTNPVYVSVPKNGGSIMYIPIQGTCSTTINDKENKYSSNTATTGWNFIPT